MLDYFSRIPDNDEDALEMYSLTETGERVEFRGALPQPIKEVAIMKREGDAFSGNMPFNEDVSTINLPLCGTV